MRFRPRPITRPMCGTRAGLSGRWRRCSDFRERESRVASRLAIIIVNFRTPALTVDCLVSLHPEVAANPGTRVVVVENGSGDNSAKEIQSAIDARAWGEWCVLIASEKNWGFAGGNNR